MTDSRSTADAEVAAATADQPRAEAKSSRRSRILSRLLAAVDVSSRLALVTLLVYTVWSTWSGLRSLWSPPDALSAAMETQAAETQAHPTIFNDVGKTRWEVFGENERLERSRLTRDEVEEAERQALLRMNVNDDGAAPPNAIDEPFADSQERPLLWRVDRPGVKGWIVGGQRGREGFEGGLALLEDDGLWTTWTASTSKRDDQDDASLLPLPPNSRRTMAMRDEDDSLLTEFVEVPSPSGDDAWRQLSDFWRRMQWKVTEARDTDGFDHVCSHDEVVIGVACIDSGMYMLTRLSEKHR